MEAFGFRRYFVCGFPLDFFTMKTLAVVIFLLGVAIFVLPLLNVQLALFYWLGNYRMLTAVLMILIGVGIFLFSAD